MAKKYTKEFKIEACKLIIEDGVPVRIVAEKFAISHIMLHRWVNEYKADPEESFVGKGKQKSADAEIRKLKRELEDARIENEILKKAAAYFAQKHGKK